MPGAGDGFSGTPATGPGLSITGIIALFTRFQFPTVTGTTGWIFKIVASPFVAPKSKVNLKGRLIKELIDGLQAAGPGSVVWDGSDLDGQRAASGVYFVQVLSGGQKADHKMVLLK